MKSSILVILMIMVLPFLALAAEGGSFLEMLMPGGLVATAVVMLVEFVLGKTDWVKANSIVELVLNMVLKLFKKDQDI